MRKSKSITIEGQQVKVLEMRPSEVNQYIQLFEAEIQRADADTMLKAFFADGLEYAPLVSVCVECDTPVDQWGVDAYAKIYSVWREVNSGFFARGSEGIKALVAAISQTQKQS